MSIQPTVMKEFPPFRLDAVNECLPNCGNYRMAGSLLEEVRNGKKLPTPDAFKGLVTEKKGKSTQWPVITQYDLPA